MERLSYSTFCVSRFLMALCVFFCHVFEQFNYFGFFFVGVFFFMSGYGMEFSGKRLQSLTRLVPYIFYFVWFSLLYFLFFRVWIYPSSWFFVMYFLVMLIYRFVQNIYGLFLSFFLLSLFMICLGFGDDFGWMASYGAFLFGVYFARKPNYFTLKNMLVIAPLSLFVFYHIEIALWFVIPLFAWIVFSFSMKLRSIAFLGQYSFYFYCIHCFCLGLFGATWTFGGEPSFLSVCASFGLSCFLSYFFKEYLFSYPRVK